MFHYVQLSLEFGLLAKDLTVWERKDSKWKNMALDHEKYYNSYWNKPSLFNREDLNIGNTIFGLSFMSWLWLWS